MHTHTTLQLISLSVFLALGIASVGCKDKAGQQGASSEAPKTSADKCRRVLRAMTKCHPSSKKLNARAQKKAESKFLAWCQKSGLWRCWDKKKCENISLCLKSAFKEEGEKRSEQKYKAKRLKDQRSGAPASLVKKKQRYRRMGFARVESPFPSLSYYKKGSIRIGADPFIFQLTFQAKKGALLKVDGKERRATSKDQRFTFTIDLKARFRKALSALQLPGRRKGQTTKFPNVMLEIPVTMKHPKHDLHRPSSGVIKISAKDILHLWLLRKIKAKEPMTLPGEGTDTPSGKVALYLSSSKLYYLSRSGGTLYDARYYVKAISFPTRTRRCGPYRSRRTGRRSYYKMNRNDAIMGLYIRKTGRRKAKKRFWAGGRCPRLVRGGSISSEHWRDADFSRWANRYLK